MAEFELGPDYHFKITNHKYLWLQHTPLPSTTKLMPAFPFWREDARLQVSANSKHTICNTI